MIEPLDPDDTRLVAALSETYGSAVSLFYQDACTIVRLRLPSVTHIVGHLMREIEGAVLDCLFPLGAAPPSPNDDERENHRLKIRLVLDSLGVSDDAQLRDDWEWLVRRLHTAAHRSGQLGPRASDPRFIELWSRFRRLVASWPRLQEENTLRFRRLLDEFLAISNPTKHDTNRFAAQMPHGSPSLGYFFDNLIHAGWLEPLERRGYFSEFPAPVPADGGGFRFLAWPAARFLERMVAARPEAVTRVLTTVQLNGNWRGLDDIIAAAVQLPAVLAGEVAARVSNLLRNDDSLYLFQPERIGTLAVHLAQGGAVVEALDLMSAALAVLPADPGHAGFIRPATRLRENYDYPTLLEATTAPLTENAGIAWIGLLIDLLRQAIELSYETAPLRHDDNSVIWRPAVEAHEQNLPEHNARGLLITALRDAAIAMVAKHGAELGTVAETLWDGEWSICQRIALHVIAECDDTGTVASQFAQKRVLLDDYTLRHEGARMLRHQWHNLESATREQILEWVAAGPEQPELEHVELNWWRLRWLTILKDCLDDDRRSLLEQLTHLYGAPEHPDFTSWHGSTSWRIESPFTREQLGILTLDEIDTVLTTWEPQPDSFGSNYEQLGRELRAVVTARADEFAANAVRWGEVRAVYVRNIVEGLREAVRDDRGFSWDSVLDLCDSVLKHTWARDSQRYRFGDDPDWSWVRQAVANLLEAGLSRRGIPAALRERVWGLINALAEDRDISIEDEYQDESSATDALTRSMSSVAGAALHAAVAYTWWLHQRGVRFDEMPEVAVLLNRALDPAVDGTARSRAVLAYRLNTLIEIDIDWTRTRLTTIFVWNDTHPRASLEVWHAYLGFNHLAPALVPEVIEQCFSALPLVAEQRVEERDTSGTTDRLALVWLTAPDEYHAVASRVAELQDDAVSGEFVNSLQHIGPRLDASRLGDSAQRAAELWKARLGEIAAEPHSHQAELVAWTGLFAWESLPADASLVLLAESAALLAAGNASARTLRRYDVRQLVERLRDCASAYPSLAVEGLAKLVSIDPDGFGYFFVEDQMTEMLAIARASGDAEAVRGVRALANRLLARGRSAFYEFAD